MKMKTLLVLLIIFVSNGYQYAFSDWIRTNYVYETINEYDSGDPFDGNVHYSGGRSTQSNYTAYVWVNASVNAWYDDSYSFSVEWDLNNKTWDETFIWDGGNPPQDFSWRWGGVVNHYLLAAGSEYLFHTDKSKATISVAIETNVEGDSDSASKEVFVEIDEGSFTLSWPPRYELGSSWSVNTVGTTLACQSLGYTSGSGPYHRVGMTKTYFARVEILGDDEMGHAEANCMFSLP